MLRAIFVMNKKMGGRGGEGHEYACPMLLRSGFGITLLLMSIILQEQLWQPVVDKLRESGSNWPGRLGWTSLWVAYTHPTWETIHHSERPHHHGNEITHICMFSHSSTELSSNVNAFTVDMTVSVSTTTSSLSSNINIFNFNTTHPDRPFQ